MTPQKRSLKCKQVKMAAKEGDAQKPPQSLAEGVDKELTCAICLSRLVHPKVLPCLHTYCRKCLETLLEKARDKKPELTCPQCQEVHQLPRNGADGFKSHFTYNNLIELLHVHAKTSGVEEAVILCGSGVDEDPAVARCLTCEDYLCESCYVLHKKQKVTRDHTVLLLEEIKSSSKKEGVRSLRKKQYCDEHKDEVLKLFCKTCQSVICRDCVLIKHREHEYVFVQEIREETQKKLEELMERVQAKEGETRAHIEHIEKIQEANVKSVDSEKQEVEKTFEQIKAALDARKAILLAKLCGGYEAAEKQIKAEADSAGLTLVRLSNSVHFTRQLLDNGDDVEVMSMSQQTQETLESLAKTTWDKTAVKPTSLKFQKNKQMIAKCGAVFDPRPLKPDDIAVELPKEANTLDKFTCKIKMLDEDKVGCDFDEDLNLSVKVMHNNRAVPARAEQCAEVWSCIPNKVGKHTLTIVQVSNSNTTVLQEHTILVKPPVMRVGRKVVRGPNWRWDNQDGGKGGVGTVTEVRETGWVSVRWENGREYSYRWGANSAYDLQIS